MPSLILSSRYTADSQNLRQAASNLGWETLRLESQQVPDWFESPDDAIALFYTAPHAFDVAHQLSRRLLGCTPDWTPRLPFMFRNRELKQMSLGEALKMLGTSFVKHAVSKAFPAGIYNPVSLQQATARIDPKALVHVGEPVGWLIEFRCFVLNRTVAAISPYRRRSFETHSLPEATPFEVEAAKEFALSVLNCPEIDCPPAFVLDVGQIEGRGWAVVEVNECWSSGIYQCDSHRVLEVLMAACVPIMGSESSPWDFRQHYSIACGISLPGQDET